ncbi:MAG: metallophosphoesterase [Waddliaceae bacterium]|nr:metallophosphoesterase [Waddliaceae bacterium]
MKIFHLADLHLGRRRLHGRLSDQDFSDAFLEIVKRAVDESADLLLIAGDLFDSHQIAPRHLRQAILSLSLLREKGIPVIAIEGNHDRASLNSQEGTWLEYLADEELLILLQTLFDRSGPILTDWCSKKRRGSIYTLNGIRFVGAGYLGASTPTRLQAITEKLDAGTPSVLLLHAGPSYFVGEGGGFQGKDLKNLKKHFIYVALGHMHKPMIHDHWAVNPGSPENCRLSEASYENRGYAVVEICEEKLRSVEIHSNSRRPIIECSVDCSPIAKFRKGVWEKLLEHILLGLRKKELSENAVIHVRLSGSMNIRRLAVDKASLEKTLEEELAVEAVFIDHEDLHLFAGRYNTEEAPQRSSRKELERKAIQSLLMEEGKEDPSLVDLCLQLKHAVEKQSTPEEILESLLQAPAEVL